MTGWSLGTIFGAGAVAASHLDLQKGQNPTMCYPLSKIRLYCEAETKDKDIVICVVCCLDGDD